MRDKKGADRISTTTAIRISTFRQGIIHGLANAAFGTQIVSGLLGSDAVKRLLVGLGLFSIPEIVHAMCT
ncbi:hypothetical protein VU08_05830 [Desulfobulbus sp. F5]|nr:hypothetical protein [Desulfobulbus sp. F5]